MLVQSSHSIHAKRRTLKENKSNGAKARKVPARNLLICSGMASRKPFCRSSCQRGSTSQMIGCQFPGGDRMGKLYGFTWTLASLVTSCIGRCCESFAFSQALPLGVRSATCVGGIR